MNTEQLHYFELAYGERNFSAAARRVPCTPQGLTKAIHALEKELGVTLFNIDPATGSPVPTDFAHELFEYVCVMNSNRRLLADSFDRIRGQEHRLIKLGCALGIIGALGPEFLGGFKALHPNVDVDYHEANDRSADDCLERGDADLGLGIAPYRDGFIYRELYRCPVYYWVRRGHPLWGRDVLSYEDLAGCDVAIPGAGFKCHDRLLERTSKAGAKLGQVFEMSEIFQLYDFAENGKGLGFSVEHLVRLPIFNRNDDVRAIPVDDEGWGFGVQRTATHALGEAEAAFWSWCCDYCAQRFGQ